MLTIACLTNPLVRIGRGPVRAQRPDPATLYPKRSQRAAPDRNLKGKSSDFTAWHCRKQGDLMKKLPGIRPETGRLAGRVN